MKINKINNIICKIEKLNKVDNGYFNVATIDYEVYLEIKIINNELLIKTDKPSQIFKKLNCEYDYYNDWYYYNDITTRILIEYLMECDNEYE